MERFANEDDEDYVFLDAGGIILELMPQKSVGQDPGFHHISFEVDSVEESARELKEKGRRRSPGSPSTPAAAPASPSASSRGRTS